MRVVVIFAWQIVNMKRVKGLLIDFDCLTWNRCTYGEWISTVTRYTTADRTVVNDHAIGIESAWVWTRIYTFIILACLLWGTLWTSYTFGSTSRWCSDIHWQTWTNCLPGYFFAFAVGSAGWGSANVFIYDFFWEKFNALMDHTEKYTNIYISNKKNYLIRYLATNFFQTVNWFNLVLWNY